MQVAATKRQPKATERPAASSERHSGPARAAVGAAQAGVGGAPGASGASNTRHQNEGHGRRLTQAFEALEAFPALAESRKRLLTVMSKDHVATADVVSAVESDVALVTAVLRMANRAQSARGRVDTVVAAVDLLSPQAVTSLLHDVGKLVLLHAYPGYPAQVHQGAQTPEERIHQERRELGVDHALVGGVLARRWGLPVSVATVIERHHSPEATGEAAFVRLADMLAHYALGAPVSPAEMLHSARTVGLGPEDLRRVMYELPNSTNQRQRHVDPCPLSGRELGVLQRLAEGKVYKQIAHELTLSTSTVRTHLHNIYGKLGAVDRAQAVLIATERGWL
jgi:HD-like signal output (HDOD) protein/DNA-binding CsgD family transcriptional regulator